MKRAELRSSSEALNVQTDRVAKARYQPPRLGGKLALEAVTHFDCEPVQAPEGPKPSER